MMKLTVFKFWRCESGAVTIDWVVLTAAIVGLGLVVVVPIGHTTGQGAQQIGTQISELNSGYRNN
jgi:hypothetical protein